MTKKAMIYRYTYKITLHYDSSPVTLRVHEHEARILTSRGHAGENSVECWYVYYTHEDHRHEWLARGQHEVYDWSAIKAISVVYPEESEDGPVLDDKGTDGR